jgi:indolepyruvate ferredoxin oxidoreductase
MNAPLPEHIRKALETVTLDDKYSLDYGHAFMSGVQALVKLPMLQQLRDKQQGKNTAGFISGLPRLAAGQLRPGAGGKPPNT